MNTYVTIGTYLGAKLVWEADSCLHMVPTEHNEGSVINSSASVSAIWYSHELKRE